MLFHSADLWTQEVLFAPLTGLEVRDTRVEKGTLVVEVALSVNLASLTIEGVISRRKKMLSDMVPGLQVDLRQALAREGVATTEGVQFLEGRLAARCAEGALGHEDAWYNKDEQLQAALDELLAVGRGMGPRGGQLRAEELVGVEAVATAVHPMHIPC